MPISHSVWPSGHFKVRITSFYPLLFVLAYRFCVCRKGSKCALLSLHEGDHVGEETLILNRRWSLSVVAAEYTEVVCLDSCALHRALDKSRTLSALGEASLDGWLCRAAGGDGMKASLKASADFQRQCRVVQTNMAQTQQKKKIMQMLEKADLGNEVDLIFYENGFINNDYCKC